MKKIIVIFNILWWICVGINLGSILWFVLGSTAIFQRGFDLVATVLLVVFGIPSLILLTYSLYVLKNGGVKSAYSMLGITVILVLMIFLSVPFYKHVNTNGWFTGNIEMGTIQVAADN